MKPKLKYIIIDSSFPIVFTECLTHKDLIKHLVPTSAGFCSRSDIDNKWTCYGESISLDLKSKGEEDAALLNLFIG